MVHLLDAHGRQFGPVLAGGFVDGDGRSAEAVAGAAFADVEPDGHLQRELLDARRTGGVAVDPVKARYRVWPQAFAARQMPGFVNQSEAAGTRIAGRYQDLAAARVHR